MYKYKNNLFPSSFDNLIKSKTYKYNFRHKKSFDIGNSRTTKKLLSLTTQGGTAHPKIYKIPDH